MTRLSRAIIMIAVMLLSAVAPSHAQDHGMTYVVSYVEASPATQDGVRAALRKLRDSGRKEAGNTSFDILQRIGEPHFVVLEVWKDAKAQADHAAATETRQARESLKPLLIAPYDERVNFAFATGPSGKPRARSLYVVTHVDFVGAKKDDGLAAIKPMAAASASEKGVERYEVLQQTTRPNHITLVEVWRSRAALEAHMQSEPMRKFREQLLPIGGALYDQRLYRLVN
jgi:quinol monooxygenase YgiN